MIAEIINFSPEIRMFLYCALLWGLKKLAATRPSRDNIYNVYSTIYDARRGKKVTKFLKMGKKPDKKVLQQVKKYGSSTFK